MPSPDTRATPATAVRWPAVAKIMMFATALGALESLAGIFALGDQPATARTAYLLAMNWIGAGFAIGGYTAALRLPWARPYFWRRVFTADALTFLPQGIVVWTSTWLIGAGMGVEILWLFVANTFVLSGAFIAAFVAPTLDAQIKTSGNAPPARKALLDRLPFRLRSAQLWALEADDHYVRAITSEGEAMIRMRLADAIAMLGGLEGVQPHRSWWIARVAVRDVRREDGRPRLLILPDGREIPISRSGSRALTQAGWF